MSLMWSQMMVSLRVPIPEANLHAPREVDGVQQSLGSMGFRGNADDFEDEDQVMSKTHLHTPAHHLHLFCGVFLNEPFTSSL